MWWEWNIYIYDDKWGVFLSCIWRIKKKREREKTQQVISLGQRVAAPRVQGPTAGTLSAWDKVFRQRSLPRCSASMRVSLSSPPSQLYPTFSPSLLRLPLWCFQVYLGICLWTPWSSCLMKTLPASRVFQPHLPGSSMLDLCNHRVPKRKDLPFFWLSRSRLAVKEKLWRSKRIK